VFRVLLPALLLLLLIGCVMAVSGCKKRPIVATPDSTAVTTATADNGLNTTDTAGTVPSSTVATSTVSTATGSAIRTETYGQGAGDAPLTWQDAQPTATTPPTTGTTTGTTTDGTQQTVTPATFQVTVQIDCKTAYAADPEAIGAQWRAGVILASTKITVTQGSTVKDLLEATGLSLNAANGYVRGIAGLNEKDMGAQSGWVFFVNGKVPSLGYHSYVLKKGDKVRWRYTCDGGADINATL
jgi:hypothetical protein